MWFEYTACFSVCLAFLYLPGLIALLPLRLNPITLMAISPLLGVACYGVLPIAYGLCGIPCTTVSLFGPALCVAFLLSFVSVIAARRQSDQRQSIETADVAIVFSTLAVSVLLVIVFFTKNLDTANSIFQAFDNGHHLNKIATFIATGNYSSFGFTEYTVSLGSVVSPYLGTEGFYPSAWHGLVAMCCSAAGANVAVGINAVNTALVAVVFPLGMTYFISCIFKSRRLTLVASVLVLAVSSSVWDFVSFGPLYPMLYAYALVPSCMGLFVVCFDCDDIFRLMGKIGAIVLAGIAIVLAQPSGIFFMAIALAPYLVSRIYFIAKDKVGDRVALYIASGAAVVVFFLWFVCFRLPALQSTVSFNWPKTESLFQAAIDIAFLSTTDHTIQIGVALLVAVGLTKLWNSKVNRWLVFSYGLVCLGYFLSVSTEGFLKHLFGGFWYTDPHRLGANLAIMATVIACFGIKCIYQKLVPFIVKHWSTKVAKRYALAILCVYVALIYLPSFELKGLLTCNTGFGNYANTVSQENRIDNSHVLTNEELVFSRKALSILPASAGVINEPNDGSAFLSSLTGMNVYYRRFSLPSSDAETKESQLIRNHLSEISYNCDVRSACDKLGLKYVLILDLNEQDNPHHFWSYFPDQWEGIETIDDETPGFKTVLSEGSMRLYEIE